MFSKEGPNLTKPAVTKRPKVTPKMQSVINKEISGTPILKIETPNRGIAIKDAGIRPINAPNFFEEHHIVANT